MTQYRVGQKLRKIWDNRIVTIKEVGLYHIVIDGDFELDHVIMNWKVNKYYKECKKMKVSFYENNDFLVTETITRIYNVEHQFDISLGNDNVKHIEYFLTSDTNVLFAVIKEIEGNEYRTTYGLSSWEVTIK